MRLYIRAPNHLGDGVMAMPAIEAATALGEVVVAAPPWGAELYRALDVEVVERGTVPDADVALLLAPSFRAAWEARRVPRRVGVRWDMRGPLLTDVVEMDGLHRSLEYRRLVEVLGGVVEAHPRFAPTAEERAACVAPEGHVALIPCSPSGAVVQWPGFAELAAAVPEAVVYVGPKEAFAGGVCLGLGELAAALERARVVVVNDSGLSHFARAVGVRTLVIHGSTSPERTGAVGSVPIEGPELPCRPCYEKSCTAGGVPCLDIPVEVVLAAIHP
ncbi:MAG TPA: glycosyltransferase family 9 protein [Myxococcota bacterium]|nr:glycosyltransferase family 9 protein [Myxococcota bacterium]